MRQSRSGWALWPFAGDLFRSRERRKFMTMIETRKLRKTFGPIEAVKGVSFRVEKGEVLGFLGPNGAGKSTVMRMLTCFLTPSSGTATVNGHDILQAPMAVRQCVGYVPESNPLYSDMNAESFLSFIAEVRGYSGEEKRRRVDQVIDTCWLTDVRHQMLETLSKGFKRRVGLAQALIHDPPILILDEPTDGLDPNQKHEVRTLIGRMSREKAIIISTHILEEVDAVCTRAIVISEGRVVADGTPEDLRKRSRYHGALRLGLKTDSPRESVEESLRGLEGVESVEMLDVPGDGNSLLRLVVYPRKGRTISQAVVSLLVGRNWHVEEIAEESGQLDDVFRNITTEKGKKR